MLNNPYLAKYSALGFVLYLEGTGKPEDFKGSSVTFASLGRSMKNI